MRYRIARALLRFALLGFFRRIHLQGAERIPEGGPVLFISNHTNAFVDPLLVLTGIRRPVTLTAKSTLRRNPLLAPVIWALGAILLHRRSDEGEDPGQNVEALDACVDRLRSGGAIFIFPEGVSHSDPGMREFRTGAARIVAGYLEGKHAPELWIVPVGLHFPKKDRWRSEAVALVGEPVGAGAWAGGEAIDARSLTRAMRGWIEALTVNFSSTEERDLIMDADRLFSHRSEGPEPLDRCGGLDAEERVDRVHRLQRGAHTLRKIDPDRFAATTRDTRQLAARLDNLGVDASEVSLSMHPARAAMFVLRELEVLVVGAPIALWGWLVHWLPLTVTRRLVERMSHDEDHPASNAVFLSIPIFLMWWIVLLVACARLAPIGVVALIVPSLPLGVAVYLRYRDRVGSAHRRMRTFLLWVRSPELREALELELEGWRRRLEALEPILVEASSRDDPELRA